MQTPAESVSPSPAETKASHRSVWSWLAALMFGAVLAAAATYTVPNLITDWQVRDTAIPFADGRVAEGRCRAKLFVHHCSATLSAQTKTGRFFREVNYVFFDLHTGDYRVAVMADPARPELLTTDQALEKLWSRTLTLLVGGGLLLALVLAPFVSLVRSRR
ncbi:hypothetical protein [Falsiroseomonas tokyonensis]|uniref:DUF3592 domain-containing protein n=1 Tax=Falsiroseomonas tokyonensis TaxID=430521 RepID=A0ABV7BVP0_9PROT|nr:hypothetical protein [Falsiroseomonas tokyonensis]MBU8538545.1 hypothetical protein [Falsiroseomonas tokyonensis]